MIEELKMEEEERLKHLDPALPPVEVWNWSLVCPAKLRSSYKDFHKGFPKFTNRTSTFTGCLDYVFITPELRVLGAIDPLSHALQPGDDDVKPCPNKHWPSDHLPHVTDLRHDDAVVPDSQASASPDHDDDTAADDGKDAEDGEDAGRDPDNG